MSAHRRPFPPVLAAIVLLLGACTLGPDYETPGGALPVSFQEAAVRGAPVWPSPSWWKGFRSPELDGLVAEALAGNTNIQAAVARIRQADAALTVAGAPLLPALSATGQDQWDRSSLAQRRTSAGVAGQLVGAGRYLETRTYSAVGSASYELDFWGRLRANRDVAVGNALFSRFDQETVALTAVTSVATTWFQALEFQDRLDVARRNLADAEQILAAIRARATVGTASLLDVSQQEALVAGLRAQVPGLRNQLQQQVNGLGILTGQMPEAITVRPGTLTRLSLPDVAPGLPSELLARRPDVAAAEANLMAANASIRAARAAFFPAIQLTGTGGWESLALGTLFGPGSFFLQAAASATQPIFNNGQLTGQLEQEKGRWDELVATYRGTVIQAFTDVENALTDYRFTTEQEALTRDAVAVAQRAADIARAQTLAGTSDIVQALQAQTTLYNDLDLLAQARFARFSALVNLYKALGGGWTRGDTVPPETPLFQGML